MQLARVADELEQALQTLVDLDLVAIRRHEFWLEVEVRTDILFASGVATLSDNAIPALDALAATLAKYPNPVRVEGHTDNQPINTRYYPSNWELSAARAASVVHRFARRAFPRAPVGDRIRRVPPERDQRHGQWPQCQSPRGHCHSRG